ncbi:MAG: serine/threonine protein kinase, partial [Planctomycetota bacterium]
MTSHAHRWFWLVIVLALNVSASAENWPAWRGPRGDGICSEKGLPTTWNKTENVAWKVKLPERGNSTPAVWGDRVFVTQAIEKEGRRTLICFNRANGQL